MSAVLAVLYLGYAPYWFCSFDTGCILDFAVSCLSLCLLALYGGKRGKKLKWLLYVFYPAHLIVLTAVKLIWGVGW